MHSSSSCTVNNEKKHLEFSCYQHRSKIHWKTIGFLSQNDTICLYIYSTWNYFTNENAMEYWIYGLVYSIGKFILLTTPIEKKNYLFIISYTCNIVGANDIDYNSIPFMLPIAIGNNISGMLGWCCLCMSYKYICQKIFLLLECNGCELLPHSRQLERKQRIYHNQTILIILGSSLTFRFKNIELY